MGVDVASYSTLLGSLRLLDAGLYFKFLSTNQSGFEIKCPRNTHDNQTSTSEYNVDAHVITNTQNDIALLVFISTLSVFVVVGWIVRLPDQPRVIVRDLGNRGFADIPMSELAALVLEVRTQDEFMGREDIYRAVLDHYGLQKLTALVRRRLDKVLEVYF